jgi:hypothetical protein
MTEDQRALAEANRIRTETMRERYPGWEESLAETSAYLASLGKAPLEYVRAWAAFRPSIADLHRNPPVAGMAQGRPALRPRAPDTVFDDWRLGHATYRLAG